VRVLLVGTGSEREEPRTQTGELGMVKDPQEGQEFRRSLLKAYLLIS